MDNIRKLYRKLFRSTRPERPENNLMSMPVAWIGQVHNASTDPCDMLCGPCACGAWHHLNEWIIIRKKLTRELGWVDPR